MSATPLPPQPFDSWDTYTSGPNVSLTALSTRGLLDAHLRDRANFGLPDNALSALLSLASGLCLLLLADVASRFVVRSRAHVPVSGAEIRAIFLLTRSANPLYGLLSACDAAADVAWRVFKHSDSTTPPPPAIGASNAGAISGGAHDGGIAPVQPACADDMHDDEDENSPFRHQRVQHTATPYVLSGPSRVAIVATGLSLAALQFLLIFAASNRGVPVALDRAALPAFALARGHLNGSLVAPVAMCETRPLVAKHGFMARAQFRLCGRPVLQELNNETWPEVVAGGPGGLGGTTADFVILEMRRVDTGLVVTVQNRFVATEVRLHLAVETESGALFQVHPALQRDEAAAELERSLRASGLLTAGLETFADVEQLPLPNWVVRLTVLYEDARVPRNFVAQRLFKAWRDFAPAFAAHPVVVRHAVFCAYIATLATSIVDLSGSARATQGGVGGQDIAAFAGPLVTKKRPWLGLLLYIIIAVALAIVWVFVVFVFDWGSGVDYCEVIRDSIYFQQ